MLLLSATCCPRFLAVLATFQETRASSMETHHSSRFAMNWALSFHQQMALRGLGLPAGWGRSGSQVQTVATEPSGTSLQLRDKDTMGLGLHATPSKATGPKSSPTSSEPPMTGSKKNC